MTSSPVTDKNGQLLGTVSESELSRKVGGFGHDPKIELALSWEKRMIGIVTLEDIAREQESDK
jgi:CBS domain-containing protein